jgi:hypothetical protein
MMSKSKEAIEASFQTYSKCSIQTLVFLLLIDPKVQRRDHHILLELNHLS